jgi:hydrogenase maturation protease
VIGVGLLDLVLGYDHLFLIDAFLAKGACPGELRILEPADPDFQHFSSHGFNLLQVLKVGKELNLPVPDLRAVYGIAITPDPPFGEDLSAEMKQKAEALAERITTHIIHELH